jgi:hypothetical protein
VGIGHAQPLQYELYLEPPQAYVFEYDRRGRDDEHACIAAILDFVELLLGLDQLFVERPQRRGRLHLIPDNPFATGCFRAQFLHRIAQVPEHAPASQVPAALPANGQLPKGLLETLQVAAQPRQRRFRLG